MKKWLLPLLLLYGFTLSAKVRNIYIKQALSEAVAIKDIIVLGYQDSVMLYTSLHSSDTQRVFCRARNYSMYGKLPLGLGATAADLAGRWPLQGEHVLMVVDTLNRAGLFAVIQGTAYRFWDPNSIPFANSVFYVPKEAGFKPLTSCGQRAIVQAESWFCRDGCLVDIYMINRFVSKTW